MAKRGPKLERPDLTVAPVTLNLDEMTRRMLAVLGKGNMSAGVRLAARAEYLRYQRSTDTTTEQSGEPASPA
jgi:hypothetical protein